MFFIFLFFDWGMYLPPVWDHPWSWQMKGIIDDVGTECVLGVSATEVLFGEGRLIPNIEKKQKGQVPNRN